MKDVISIMTENLMNERLDKIIAKNGEFRVAESKATYALNKLEKTLDAEQNKLLSEYTALENDCSSIYSMLAYAQGMKDITNLFLKLTVE